MGLRVFDRPVSVCGDRLICVCVCTVCGMSTLLFAFELIKIVISFRIVFITCSCTCTQSPLYCTSSKENRITTNHLIMCRIESFLSVAHTQRQTLCTSIPLTQCGLLISFYYVCRFLSLHIRPAAIFHSSHVRRLSTISHCVCDGHNVRQFPSSAMRLDWNFGFWDNKLISFVG